MKGEDWLKRMKNLGLQLDIINTERIILQKKLKENTKTQKELMQMLKSGKVWK